jgi:hypothetical protein
MPVVGCATPPDRDTVSGGILMDRADWMYPCCKWYLLPRAPLAFRLHTTTS